MTARPHTSGRSTAARILVAAVCILCAQGWSIQAQDLSSYSISSERDVFGNTIDRVLAARDSMMLLPDLDCAVEYIRRAEGKDIVYRRGPVPLSYAALPSSLLTPASSGTGTQPAAAPAGALFHGGLLLDLARPGETPGTVPAVTSIDRYMLRAAVIPTRYEAGVLSATIVIERAVVDARDSELRILESEVFSRDVRIRGNEPLHFGLPIWEATAGRSRSIPPALEEALLVTLEAPRTFGFARNTPEPFSTATRIAYAVPMPSTVSLRIRVRGDERVLDEGWREPGVYAVTMDGKDIPDGSYTATLRATDADGREVHASELPLTRDAKAPAWTGEPVPRPAGPGSAVAERTVPALPPAALAQRVVISPESGAAFQLPVDAKKRMRHMFTHVAVRVGYRLSHVFEVGVLAGQDAFHETPGPDVDIERISNYGGVVPYTYGYAGPYLRVTPWTGIVQPVLQTALAFSDTAPLAELGIGARATLFSRMEVFLVPTVLTHLRGEISTKIGIHYGASVRF